MDGCVRATVALRDATLVRQFFAGESEVFPTTRVIYDDLVALPPFGLVQFARVPDGSIVGAKFLGSAQDRLIIGLLRDRITSAIRQPSRLLPLRRY